jgi:predicted ester cyclase
MDASELTQFYRRYIDCLNRQAWERLGDFVHDEVSHNGRVLELSGYRAMLENDFLTIEGLSFRIATLVCQPPHVASRLAFQCRPRGAFLGLPVDGREVSFDEHVFYDIRNDKIWRVLSLLDKAAIERQLAQA